MSWADDIRCLYCDGRLPLYRKITSGQFCSGAHRKAYWQEHERLAVERLHQTHESLRAYRPPGAIEAIFGVAEAADEADLPSFDEAALPSFEVAQQVDANPPAIAGFLQNRAWAMPQWLPDYLAAIDVAPIDSAKILRWPAIAQAVREYAVGTASWVPLALPAAAGQTALAAGVEPVESGPHGPYPIVNPRLDLAPQSLAQDSTPQIDELRVSAAEPIPDLANRLPLSLPAPRDYARPVIPENPHAECLLRAQLPLRALRMGVTLAPAALVDAGLSPHAAAVVAVAGGPLTEGLRALDLRIETSRLELSTPPVRPRLNLACGSRYKVETRESVAAAPATEPGGFAAMPAQISLPQISFVQNSPRLACGSRYKVETRVAAAPATEPEGFAAMPAQISLPQTSLLQNRPRAIAATAGAGSAVEAAGEQPGAPPPAFPPDFEPGLTGFVPLASAAQQTGSGIPIRPAPAAVLIPQPPRAELARPVSKLSPLDAKPISDAIPAARPAEVPASTAPKAHLWTHAADFWNRAPRDLKVLVFALPLLLGLMLHPSLPKVRATAPAAAAGVERNLEHAFNTQWANVRRSVVDRAAVALNEDFRAGLDDWASRDDATAAWAFDATGFVIPGPLALYRPSLDLTDYQVQFLGTIDKQALSWVARAADFDNFYVIKFNVLKSGPLPTIGLTRYAVVNGVADSRVDTIAPIDARADMLYRVRLEVHGNDFALSVQDQMVDSWTEPRLRHGGIGFFSARGEQSRIRWVQVMHQYDMLGRLCAYLAPYNVPSTTESFE